MLINRLHYLQPKLKSVAGDVDAEGDEDEEVVAEVQVLLSVQLRLQHHSQSRSLIGHKELLERWFSLMKSLGYLPDVEFLSFRDRRACTS